jgi:hypothetical protein
MRQQFNDAVLHQFWGDRLAVGLLEYVDRDELGSGLHTHGD